MNNVYLDDFNRRFGGKIKAVKSWQQKRTDQDRTLFEPRYVKGVPLLRESFNEFETDQDKRFRVETINSNELDDETLRQITDFFRYMFANAFDGQYRSVDSHATY